MMLFLLFFFTPLLGLSAEIRSGNQLKVTGTYSDNLFAAGRSVDVDVQSSDDVFLTGGTISFRGSSQQNLIAAGGSITVENAQLRELLAAGGQVHVVKAEIKDDVVAAGGRLTFGPLSLVHGSMRLTGGDIVLDGAVSGNVDVRARSLKIGPHAVISGNLTHRASTLIITPGARIEGQTLALPSGSQGGTLATIAGILFLLGILLLAPVLAIIFRRTTSGGAERVYEGFWRSLGRGALVVILISVIWLALLMSAIGTPFALATLPLLVFGGILAWTTAVYTVGTWMRAVATRRQRAISTSRLRVFAWTLLATCLVMVVLAIPVLGVLFGIAAFLTGVGALYTHLRTRLERQHSVRRGERVADVA